MISYITLALYLLAISLSVASFTMIQLANRGKSTSFNRSMRRFVLLMLIMCIYDMIIYFTGYVVGSISGAPTLRIGACIVALLVNSWTDVADKFVDNNSYKFVNHFVKIYCYAYAILWLLGVIIQRGEFSILRWLLLVTDMGLIIVLLLGGMTYIGEAVWSRQRAPKIYYLITVTALLAWNYISYFWGETSVYWGNSDFLRKPLDLTIIFWFMINTVNIIVIYQEAFKPSYANKAETAPVPEFSVDESIEAVADMYELTPREREIAKLIYEGKSNAEIASMLFISESTVKTHLYNIFRKAGVKNRIELSCVIRGDRK